MARKKLTLPAWLSRQGDAEVARKLSVSEITVRSWRLGYRRPSPALALRLLGLAGGSLNIESIYGEHDPVTHRPGRKVSA